MVVDIVEGMVVGMVVVRIEMGKNAIKHSVRYAPERIMPKWISLFNELVGQNK